LPVSIQYVLFSTQKIRNLIREIDRTKFDMPAIFQLASRGAALDLLSTPCAHLPCGGNELLREFSTALYLRRGTPRTRFLAAILITSNYIRPRADNIDALLPRAPCNPSPSACYGVEISMQIILHNSSRAKKYNI
jgi:hypothetical protein